jgi:D-alanine-D-alanine ligase
MGGWSSERPVSLASGKECADGLEQAGYRVTRIDVARDIAEVLARLKPQAVFNALHGPYGEDGTIQGVLEILGLPYSHSGVLASALAMNKHKAKRVAAGAGIPVAEHRIVSRRDAAAEHILPPPYVVKPIAEGSSFGVIIVRPDQSHPPQSLARDEWTFGEDVMVERYVAGRELTCAVQGDRALGVIEIVPSGTVSMTTMPNTWPAVQSISARHRLNRMFTKISKSLPLRAHLAIGCRGVSRSDFRIDEEGSGEIIWLEVNTQPGMTRTSLVPELAAHAGQSFPELVAWMVEDASCQR